MLFNLRKKNKTVIETNPQSETKCALINVTIRKQRNYVVMLHQAANSNACSARPHWMVQAGIFDIKKCRSWLAKKWRLPSSGSVLLQKNIDSTAYRDYWDILRLLHTNMNQHKSLIAHIWKITTSFGPNRGSIGIHLVHPEFGQSQGQPLPRINKLLQIHDEDGNLSPQIYDDLCNLLWMSIYLAI